MATGSRSAGGGDSLQVNVLVSSLQTEFKGEGMREGGGGGEVDSVCLPINMSAAAPSKESPSSERF